MSSSSEDVFTANDSRNPTYLPERFEIRRLKPEHAEWAKAIVMHSNIYYSPVWPVCYPDGKTARLHEGMKTADYLIEHQIKSGMSFGVFDTEYQFKRAESRATHGKLYWDEKQGELSGEELLEQMDFPLVSVALAYDGINPLDMSQLIPMMGTLPLFKTFYGTLAERDHRDPASWHATAPHQVLMRNATSTRRDYEGQGVMKKLAQFLMRQAKSLGYRGIQIECAHDAVTNTWLNPPAPFRGELVSEFSAWDYETKDDKGQIIHPFRPSKQVGSKVYVHL